MQRNTTARTPHIDIVQTLEREAVQVVNALSTSELEALHAVWKHHTAEEHTTHRRAATTFDTGLSWIITILSLLSSWLIIEHLWVGFVCSLVSNSLWVILLSRSVPTSAFGAEYASGSPHTSPRNPHERAQSPQ